MLTVSPFISNFIGWDYPIGLLDASINTNSDALILSHFQSSHNDNNNRDNHVPNPQPSSQAPPHHDEHYTRDDHNHDQVGQYESPQMSLSSADQQSGASQPVARRLNHNASERDRRKKINSLYKSLRALLPAADQMKQLSIPATVARVLKYIPELQKEIEDLIRKKEEISSKIALLQRGEWQFSQEEKPRKLHKNIKEEKPFSSINISVNKLGEREIVVQISTYQRLPLPEVLQLLEKHGLLVIDVSSSQSFGGRAFYNIHLWIEGTSIMRWYEMLNEELHTLIQQHNRVYF